MSRWSIPLAVLAAAVAPAAAQLPPDKALASIKPGDGLQVELFAAEPMLVNPTSMDIDHLGRVWVTEAVNYRRKNFGRPILRPEGDRIVILTDTNGDGKADESKVFYQGTDLYGPLGVCVVKEAKGPGYKVFVCQSPDILLFHDADGDGKADGPPEKFLTGFGGFDHDHGVHGINVGPDGKLYFTVGDAGVKGLNARDGKGPTWTSNATDCRAGTVWRCDLDGSHLELIAHNFRNNYECCVDSFGEIWLSDNDDDGNQQTRICFVMPGGNYGYHPRGPGQSHWHEEQPGVVHKTLRTGFGSPTGITFYEGNLLPEKFRGSLVHADAGPREIRAFHRKPKGAGYELDKTVMLTSTDNWFRPSDVCVAPDGSVFVADWYDPGVGGHGMGDWTRGRVYRLTPQGHKGYKVPAVKLDTKQGVLAALDSPCQATRALVHSHLESQAKPEALTVLADGVREQSMSTRARSIWQLGQLLLQTPLDQKPQAALDAYYDSGFSSNPETATAFYRIESNIFARERKFEGVPMDDAFLERFATSKVKEYSVAYGREMLLNISRNEDYQIKPTFFALAKLYDGKDHFYRAALNIACGTNPARRDAILADFDKHFPEWNDTVADLVWELRPKSVLPRLEKLLGDSKLTAAQKGRIVDILAASDDPAAGTTMLRLLTGDAPAEVRTRAVENLRLFLPTKWNALAKGDELKAAVAKLLADANTTATGLRLIAAAAYAPALDEVAKLAASGPAGVRVEAVRTLGKLPGPKAVDALKPLLADPAVGPAAVEAVAAQIGSRGDGPAAKAALATLEAVVTGGSASPDLRRAAVAALAGTRTGTGWLLALKEKGQFPPDLVADAGRLLRNSPFQGERNKAMILFAVGGKLDPKKLPSPAELAKRKGDAANGQRLMAKSLTGEAQCLKCHTVRGVGGQIGPDLSLIGKKGSRENLFESILYPSKAIADQYVSWQVETDDGQTITGLLVRETETTLTLRDANGKDYTLPAKGTSRRKSLQSIMPEGLVATLTEDELVDLVEYLLTLQ